MLRAKAEKMLKVKPRSRPISVRSTRSSRLRMERLGVASPTDSPEPNPQNNLMPQSIWPGFGRRRSSSRRPSNVSSRRNSSQGDLQVMRAKKKLKGWKFLRKNVHRVIHLGQQDGSLARPIVIEEEPVERLHLDAREEAEKTRVGAKRLADPISSQTHDIDMIHEAIPYLPVPVAILCFLLNVFLPGSGTVLSGTFAVCLGQPRINYKESRRLTTFLINLWVGLSQFMTVTFCLVGWGWSIAWGGLLFIHSMEYREALRERRKVAVATAAIEAITKDSILHHRDVTSLVRTHIRGAGGAPQKKYSQAYWRRTSNSGLTKNID